MPEQPAFGGTFTLKVALRPQTAKEAGLDDRKARLAEGNKGRAWPEK